jgi:hypothetical protein
MSQMFAFLEDVAREYDAMYWGDFPWRIHTTLALNRQITWSFKYNDDVSCLIQLWNISDFYDSNACEVNAVVQIQYCIWISNS